MVQVAIQGCAICAGYVWAATISLAPLMWIRGWDSYVRGELHTATLDCILGIP